MALGECTFFVTYYHIMQEHILTIHSNKADLRLLEEMGVTPDQTIREKRPTLRTMGWMVIAILRMQRMASQWAGNKKLHESLLKRLEMMRRGQGKKIA